MRPLLGTWPATQACALTGYQTSDPLVHRPALNPLSHMGQGSLLAFNAISNIATAFPATMPTIAALEALFLQPHWTPHPYHTIYLIFMDGSPLPFTSTRDLTVIGFHDHSLWTYARVLHWWYIDLHIIFNFYSHHWYWIPDHLAAQWPFKFKNGESLSISVVTRRSVHGNQIFLTPP